MKRNRNRKFTGTAVVQLDDGELSADFTITAGSPSHSFYEQDDPDEIEFENFMLETENFQYSLSEVSEEMEADLTEDAYNKAQD